MKIGIVGGSIAGCSAAYLLSREGHDITIFERSRKALVGRGGGIGTLPSLVAQLKEEGLITNDFSSFHIDSMPFVGKLLSAEPYGKVAWSMPMNLEVFHWNELWQQLRRHIPDDCYQAGVQIVHAEKNEDDQVTLTAESGETHRFELVLFADGYRSIGRALMFPKKELKYRGYVLWRGLLPESKLGEKSPLRNEVLRLSFPGEPGHNVVYFIPNQDGSTNEGDRIFNWAAYIAFSEEELQDIMTDKEGRTRTGTLPPGAMRSDVEARLKAFLARNTPKHYADIVGMTEDSYIQVIYTLDLDSYYKDNMCLIGDAGIVVQPFTGSGVFKGYQNVKGLIEALGKHQGLEDALADWSRKQIKTGRELLVLGEQMEKAFIWEQPDFAQIEEEAAASWWKNALKFPDFFDHRKRE